MFSNNVVDVTEEYHTQQQKLKDSFISRVEGILRDKLRRRSSIDLGLSELTEAREVVIKEIDVINNTLREEK